MFIKKIQNSIDTLVEESIEGYIRLFPEHIQVIPGTRFIIRTEKYKKEKGKVKVVAGGGSGHEPGALNMVAPCGADLFVAGDIYAAPSYTQLFKGITMVDDGSPILFLVANHAGDVLNANMAEKMALAKGINLRKFIMYDDVATAPKGKESERRNIGGVLLRIAAIAAEKGESLDEVERLAIKARDNTRSYGVGIRSAIHPVTGLTIMPMPEDEIELGIGVHGESSGNRIKIPSSKELAKIVCDILLDDMPVKSGEEIAININGLGGLTYMEFSIFYNDIYKYLSSLGIKIFDVVCGNNNTTQELGGFVLSIGKIDDEIKKFWTP